MVIQFFDEKLEYLLIPDKDGRRAGNKNLVSRRVGEGTRWWTLSEELATLFQNGLWSAKAASVDGRGGVVRTKTVYVNWRWRCWASNGQMVSTLTSCQRRNYKLALEMCWNKVAEQLLHFASGQFTVAFWWSCQCWRQNTNWRSTQLLTPQSSFLFFTTFSIFFSLLSCWGWVLHMYSICHINAQKHTPHKYMNTGASSSISRIAMFWNMTRQFITQHEYMLYSQHCCQEVWNTYLLAFSLISMTPPEVHDLKSAMWLITLELQENDVMINLIGWWLK